MGIWIHIDFKPFDVRTLSKMHAKQRMDVAPSVRSLQQHLLATVQAVIDTFSNSKLVPWSVVAVAVVAVPCLLPMTIPCVTK